MEYLVRLFGQHPVNSVIATARFPEGEADGVPLELKYRGTSCCPDWRDPGDRVLLRFQLVAFSRLGAAVSPIILTTNSPRAFSAALPVKVAVTTCSGPAGRMLIDSDRQIIVPGPEVAIEVFAPAPWINADAAPLTEINTGEGPAAWDVVVWVTACPVKCCESLLPHLTWWTTLTSESTPEERSFVRPRGGRRLSILASDLTNTVIVTPALFSGDPVNGGALLALETIPAAASGSGRTIDPWGAVSHFTLAAPVNPERYVFRWEVGP
jgi:hypothetical protein